VLRQFVLLPYMHSEVLQDQQVCAATVSGPQRLQHGITYPYHCFSSCLLACCLLCVTDVYSSSPWWRFEQQDCKLLRNPQACRQCLCFGGRDQRL
jgi:hypothetical protein